VKSKRIGLAPFGILLVAVALLVAWASRSEAQPLPTCAPASTVQPQPWNETRVAWVAPTTYATTPPTPLPAGAVLTYTVLRRTGTSGAFVAICQTTATGTALANQPIGQNFYTATARITGTDSVQAAPASKDIVEPPPSPPTNITVASTRIDPYEWTCRDSSGAVLTNHRSAVEAQTECTNRAVAALERVFEIRPSGYRIVARAR